MGIGVHAMETKIQPRMIEPRKKRKTRNKTELVPAVCRAGLQCARPILTTTSRRGMEKAAPVSGRNAERDSTLICTNVRAQTSWLFPRHLIKFACFDSVQFEFETLF